MPNTIDETTAKMDLERFVDMMDLDLSEDGLDEEEAKALRQHKAKAVSALMKGSLIITDNGEPVFTPTRGEENNPVTFYEPTGASLMAMDRKKKSEDIGKMYALMADITRTTAKTFSQMKMGDLKVCMALTTLFLG